MRVTSYGSVGAVAIGTREADVLLRNSTLAVHTLDRIIPRIRAVCGEIIRTSAQLLADGVRLETIAELRIGRVILAVVVAVGVDLTGVVILADTRAILPLCERRTAAVVLVTI